MSNEKLIEQIGHATSHVGVDAKKFIKNAFEWAFGKRHNIETEADMAYKRFHKRKSFSERTFNAISQYIAHLLGWPPLSFARS